ncbi:TetR/AcrR family transcriptional regulator [Pseudonocardia sp. TRM90224]|uniref:TetR/AcrR family transcriptional regulator n=1 Tax=Pseudonocardia sp. TRM90224 TaxID=2812678 RepID=UPI001E3C3733|nr:TetR/AcrR family transcriptional regulator [Pseudonocardia sp. TRM90224]
MTEPVPRRRAPGMTPERRREMIVAAALPLVAEQGAAITTSQVARAAGIGEATIFRVFRDKDELLDACIVEALRPDTALDEIASIDLDQPLAERLTEAATALDAHLARIGAVVGALHGTRPRDRRARDEQGEHPPASARTQSYQDTIDAISALLAPEKAALRYPAEQLAGMFVSQLFARTRPFSGSVITTEQLVDLFLNGALQGVSA